MSKGIEEMLETIEWGLDTSRNKLMFGLDELNAAKSRERRLKGILLDCKNSFKELEQQLKQKDELIREAKKTIDFYADKDNWQEICIEGGISGTNIVDGDFLPCLLNNVEYGFERALEYQQKYMSENSDENS